FSWYIYANLHLSRSIREIVVSQLGDGMNLWMISSSSSQLIIWLSILVLLPFPIISAQSTLSQEESKSLELDFASSSDLSPPLEGNVEKGRSYRKTFTNEWAVLIESGREEDADRIATRYGYSNEGRILEGENYFLFRSLSIRKRSSRKTRSVQSKELSHDGGVLWMEQQISKKRVKRVAVKEGGSKMAVSADSLSIAPPNDPLWTDMWYLHGANGKKNYHNIQEVWDMGYTGKDIVVTILDDGLEWNHPDIAPNYDRKASLDVNDRDDDPMPRYEYSDENRHGTRCAGEVAAVFNNSQCIVGIAYEAKIGGIRMLDGDVTDAVEAASLSHNNHHIDIYSASWGPDDDGRTVDGPAKLTKAAFEKGIREGRKGKGNIYIWASGNGGKDADSCNCDGYTNSIYTLSISSATESGNIPWYSEACSSTLATTFSSGATGEKMIVTTDLHHACTTAHTGTSASAPLAAGIVALTLQANPSLTWRDMQHIVVRTARPLFLRAGDWQVNGVGRNVSHSFGYGLMDAQAMVLAAKSWVTVPEQHRCAQYYPSRFKSIPHGNRLQLQLYTDGCETSPEHAVTYVEHVQAIVTLKAPKRGDVQIYLTSPSGTRSTLLTKRARDTSRTGFVEWAFMSTHSWGELASGLWILDIDNDGWDDAELIKWDLVIYGTVSEVGTHGGVHSVPLAARSLSKYAVSTSLCPLSPSLSTLTSFLLILLFLIE
ncbi:hypothetical protein PMAYCL1PPCAC_23718, partial [Pristionchus mayeri]